MERELRDELFDTIKKMESGEYFNSEANTKKYIIEKVLSWLEYPVSNPSKVVMEWPIKVQAGSKSTGSSTVFLDYAVVDTEKKPRVLIEAKGLNENIKDEGYLKQLDSYLKNISPNMDVKDLPKAGIISNGKDWAVYLPKKDNPREFNFNSPYCKFTLTDILNKDSERERIKSLINCTQLVNQSSQQLQDISTKNEMSNTLKQWFKDMLTNNDFNFLDDTIFKCIVMDCCHLKPIDGKAWTAEKKNQFCPEIKKALKSVLSDINDAYYLDMLRKKADAENSVTQNNPEPTPYKSDKSSEVDIQTGKDETIQLETKDKTTQLELDIMDKLQSIYDQAELPQKLWSSKLNREFDTKLQYKDTTHYITYLFNDGETNYNNNWAIRYRGENDIRKGLIGLPLSFEIQEDVDCYGAIPHKFAETAISKGSDGFVNYVPSNVQIRITSMNDLDELRELIIYCFKKEIAFWESQNPRNK